MAVETGVVWEEFSAALGRSIRGRVSDRNAAADILQDVFYEIHKNIEKGERR